MGTEFVKFHFLLVETDSIIVDMSFEYNVFTSRNLPIVSPQIQTKIAATKILIAGCGLGSLIAESLVRLGFQHFELVDNDRIELHNLNRQAYQFKHIAREKTSSLKEVILGINPSAKVLIHNEFLSGDNVENLVRSCDIVIDTIDFLDLKAVILLHDKAHFYKKTIFSFFAAAWGTVGIVIPPVDDQAYLRTIFSVHEENLNNLSYTEKFTAFFSKLSPFLNQEVKAIMKDIFLKMQDNKPCPASVVITGAQLAAVLCEKLIFNHLNGSSTMKPQFYYLDLDKIISSTQISIES